MLNPNLVCTKAQFKAWQLWIHHLNKWQQIHSRQARHEAQFQFLSHHGKWKINHSVQVQIQIALSFFCTQLKKRAVPLSFIPTLPSSCKKSLHSIRKSLEMATEVWHYGQWLEQGFKNRTKKNFKRRVQIPPKAVSLLSQPPKKRRSPFRSQQPGTTPAPSPTCLPCWFIPCAGNCKDMGNFIPVPARSL